MLIYLPSDVYAQYGMMMQAQANPFAQQTNPAYAAYNQPMYNMGYGQSMMTGQYGAPGYPQVFPANNGYSNEMMTMPDATRTIYLGNIKRDVTPHEVLRQVRTGTVESYRPCLEKNCAFLSFVSVKDAQAFYNEFSIKKLVVGDAEIKIGWGKSNTISAAIQTQIQNGASRNVYIGRLTEADTEQTIRNAVEEFGTIETVKIVRDKNCGFVHFLTISSAISCCEALNKNPQWQDKKINFGKDYCAQQQRQQQPDYSAFGFQQPSYSPSVMYPMYGGYNELPSLIAPMGSVLRTLYIGNIHPDTKTEDLCNSIRGGNLLQLRFMATKSIAFVTFMDAATALNVFNHAQTTGLVLRGRRLRVGWGKPSTVPALVSKAIQEGATRNIYVGGIPDTLTEEQLKADFAQYGEIELVNTFREKKCAFVNFTSVVNAIAAIAAMRLNPSYSEYKLNYGKDRCGNPFKTITKKPAPTEEGKPVTEDAQKLT